MCLCVCVYENVNESVLCTVCVLACVCLHIGYTCACMCVVDGYMHSCLCVLVQAELTLRFTEGLSPHRSMAC